MLDAALKSQLKAYFERISQPIELVASLDDSPKSREMWELLEDVASQSERLTRAEVCLQRESRDLLWFGDPALDSEWACGEHRAILEAIADQDEQRARALAEQHVMASMRHLINIRLKMRGG